VAIQIISHHHHLIILKFDIKFATWIGLVTLHVDLTNVTNSSWWTSLNPLRTNYRNIQLIVILAQAVSSACLLELCLHCRQLGSVEQSDGHELTNLLGSQHC